MDRDDALLRLGRARAGRLATVDGHGRPHVVPFVFALDGMTIYWAVDAKPKRSTELKRLSNLRSNPAADVVVDHYAEDWTALWWVRASGNGRVVEDQAESQRARALLVEKFPQYGETPPPGPVVAIDLDRVTWWSASE
jgi:PPOX class probable F420-dependent enzyme